MATTRQQIASYTKAQQVAARGASAINVDEDPVFARKVLARLKKKHGPPKVKTPSKAQRAGDQLDGRVFGYLTEKTLTFGQRYGISGQKLRDTLR